MPDGIQKITVSTDKFTGMYRGKVVSVEDPEKSQRVRIRIYPIYANLEDRDLPWAYAATPMVFGMGDGFGTTSSPTIGSWVWCFFEGGDLYSPVYFAYAPAMINGVPVGSNRGRGEDDDIMQTVNTGLVTNIPTNISGTWDETEIQNPSYNSDTVIKTEGGILVELDDNSVNKRVFVYHPSGAYVSIQHDGSIHTHAVKDTVMVSKGTEKNYIAVNSLHTIGGNLDMRVDGQGNLSFSNGLTIGAGGSISVNGGNVAIGGSANVSITGGDIAISGSATVAVDGATVTINGGTKGCARIDDEVYVTGPDSAVYYGKINACSSTVFVG